LVRRRAHGRNLQIKLEAEEAGLTEPTSLHPLIDEVQCIGCAACVTACPEAKHNVLGVIGDKAHLINPTFCIGHGACKAACPIDAITLVFGTARRGVDIPLVQPNFETNLPGMFIAGELGGMGLIRNAMEQGKQAMQSIASVPGMGSGDMVDVVIIGAGPSGIAATLGAKDAGLKSVTIEQDSLGGTVYNFPRGKLVMTAPVELPIVGRTHFTETTKEALLAYFGEIIEKADLKINFQERMDNITPLDGGGYLVKTPKDEYRTRTVLLCIGRRGTPRKLGVPGEDVPKVVYRLIDPAQYQGMSVLVVGGGDSALEAATSIADEEGTTVTLSYRSEAFGRAKDANRKRVAEAEAAGRLTLMMKSGVKEVTENTVKINWQDEVHEIPNDGIIVCAGGILPTPFLKQIGILVETKYGTV
jgi:thioredoxin reductase/Pyruvate/2-oxoacid:ferredoxin oxidoreductase delta subunit